MKAFTQMRLLRRSFFIAILAINGWQASMAQNPMAGQSTSKPPLRTTVASFRDDVRQSVLMVSQYPHVLKALTQQRNNTEQAFLSLIQSYGQTKQGWFYDLARYPDVLHNLATLPARSERKTVDELTKSLPADLQETAWKLYRHHNDDLVQIDNLNQQAEQEFSEAIEPLEGSAQQAFRQLISLPDVLTQLTGQLDQTIQLGDAYRANPDQVTSELTATHDSLTVQNQRALADYESELDRDPQAKQELQQAGQAYAQANGYRTGINPNPAWVNTNYYNQNPYPFWFGYPYWYASPVWYPSAWWNGTGFYYGMGGNAVVFGLPSWGFSNWFFGYGPTYYPRLYNRFNNYYVYNMGPRRVWAPANAGFMSAAHRALGRANGFGSVRSNWLSRGNNTGGLSSNGRLAVPGGFRGANSGSYRAPATGWGGGIRTYSGGGFRGGNFGGGFRGGGRR